MSPTMWLLALLLAWCAFGAIQAMYLARRGFDGLSWFLVGIVLGPLSILVAWNCVRRDEELRPRLVHPGVAGDGSIDVLIGFDGSPESRAAIDGVERALGTQLRRVGLATVVHFDDPPEHERAKLAELERAARALDGARPELLVVRGHPSTALAKEAQVGHYDLIAIGATGRGHAHLFGSAAKELIQRSPVPVLVAGQRLTAEATPVGVGIPGQMTIEEDA